MTSLFILTHTLTGVIFCPTLGQTGTKWSKSGNFKEICFGSENFQIWPNFGNNLTPLLILDRVNKLFRYVRFSLPLMFKYLPTILESPHVYLSVAICGETSCIRSEQFIVRRLALEVNMLREFLNVPANF